MYHWRKKVGVLAALLVLSACAGQKKTTTYYTEFVYRIDNTYQVKHRYPYGSWDEQCRYDGIPKELYATKSSLPGTDIYLVLSDFFEKNGHVYQGSKNMDKEVIGYPFTSRLGGSIDPKLGVQEMMVNHVWRFDALCSSQTKELKEFAFGKFKFTVRLQKSSSISIVDDIEQTRKLLDIRWKRFAYWEPVKQVNRGENQWTLFKNWDGAKYAEQASEDWYLPVGDGKYYYLVTFFSPPKIEEKNKDKYSKYYEVFAHILDSFEIRELTAQEKKQEKV